MAKVNLVFEEPRRVTRKIAEEFRDLWMPMLLEMQKHPGRWVLMLTRDDERAHGQMGHYRHRLARATWLPGKYDFTVRSNKEDVRMYGKYLGPK